MHSTKKHTGTANGVSRGVLVVLVAALVSFALAGPASADTAAPDGDAVAAQACADANNDGVVSVADIALTVQNFGYRWNQPPPGFNPKADHNGDGVGSVADILIVIQQFGWIC